MIYDKIENIELYKGLSDDIYAGLRYLKDMTPDVEPGTYEINPRVKAFISEYTTKPENEKGYEAHQKNIDIQYLLKGTEKIACLPVDELQETQPYNEDTDAAFYASPSSLSLHPSALGHQPSSVLPLPSSVTLLPGYFSIFYPQDAHMPCLCMDTPTKVKKVVIKVKITNIKINERIKI